MAGRSPQDSLYSSAPESFPQRSILGTPQASAAYPCPQTEQTTHFRRGTRQSSLKPSPRQDITCVQKISCGVSLQGLVGQPSRFSVLYYHRFRQPFIFTTFEVRHGEGRKWVQGGRPAIVYCRRRSARYPFD